jgi:hypothetical protein
VPLYTPSYGGQPIFGAAVTIQQIPFQCAQQLESFFGVPGLLSVFGGPRGRTFNISGILYDIDLPTLNSDEDVFTPGVYGSVADGIARPLVDTRGRTWANVVYLGEFMPDPGGPRPGNWGAGSGGWDGWILPYRAIFHGLS